MKKFGFWNRFIENQIDNEFGVKDIDNNHYSLKTFNNRIWMTENLNVSRFRNGDLIKEVKSNEDWINSCVHKEPAWCYYDNDNKNCVFGKLYNLHAITDYKGLAPEKFHIPSDNEWDNIVKYMGGSEIAGENMGILSKFAADLGGARDKNGSFHLVNMVGIYWSSTHSHIDKAWLRVFYLLHKNIGRNDNSKFVGAYVRCMKD